MLSRINWDIEQDRSMVRTYLDYPGRGYRSGLRRHAIPHGTRGCLLRGQPPVAARCAVSSYRGRPVRSVRHWADLEKPCLRPLSAWIDDRAAQRDKHGADDGSHGRIRVPDPGVGRRDLAHHLDRRSLYHIFPLDNRLPRAPGNPSTQKGDTAYTKNTFQFRSKYRHRTL